MREIKFRAWEKNLQEIIPVDDINFKSKMINCYSAWRNFDEVELMQYTGIKDMNNKEIYEGDIVRCVELMREDIKEFISVVHWDIDCFLVQDTPHSAEGLCTFDGADNRTPITEIEVIGNIFEWYDEDKYKDIVFYDTRTY